MHYSFLYKNHFNSKRTLGFVGLRNGLLGIALLSATSMIMGCATSRTLGWDNQTLASKTSLSQGEQKKLDAEIKKLWSNRHVKADLLAALDKLEKLASANPEDFNTLVLLSRGYYILADAHTTEMKEKKINWEKGAAWGERAMATEPEFREMVITQKKKVEDGLHLLEKKQVPAIYWTAVNLGKWSKNSGIGTALKYKSRIRQMVERVEQLDPQFFHGAVPRYWGTYYAVLPGFAGGSMEKSLAQYKKSFEVQNAYLASHVLFAENYASRKGDRKLFTEHLNFVLKANPNALPDVKSENLIEQEKAKQMLKDIESFF